MEIHLKAIGESHQAERKKLVGIHAQLSQGMASQAPASQDGLAEGSETLRSQLISLSARQKELLQCLRKQKGISNKLGMLVEREVNSRKMGQLEEVMAHIFCYEIIDSHGYIYHAHTHTHTHTH